MKANIKERIDALRAEMVKAGVAATIIPQADPHMSEYLAAHWQARRWFSGFTGSAGDLVVTNEKALLWTDSRYFLQAADQLDGTPVELMKDGLPDTPSIEQYLCGVLPKGAKLGIDGMLFSVVRAESLRAALEAHGMTVVTDFDPVGALWASRPALPDEKIFVHPVKYAGRSAAEKIADVLAELPSLQASSQFVSALDEIAWTLNIRCNDVTYNPVATAFLYLAPAGESVLFVDEAKLTPEVTAYLRSEGVAVRPYGEAMDFLRSLPADARVLIEPGRTAEGVRDALAGRYVFGLSPIAAMKACKNAVQIEGIKAAMKRDGVALVHSFMEIERRVAAGDGISEMDVAEILCRHRSAQELFFEESFGTIAGYGPHGAIVHYEADEDSNSSLGTSGLLLVDSGAQYLDGTTDITRTVALGVPTAEEKRDFTLVMKGHIAMAQMIFPEGTNGAQIDVIARQYLWKNGLSYLHGTGHGVGHFLNVHEGPQKVALNLSAFPFRPGMLTSNEPGLYRTGVHGIRCENLVLCVEAMTTEFGRFYGFETVTVFPFDLNLFDTDIMTDDEIDWINRYHEQVRATLAPSLEGNALAWLENKTRKLTR